MRHWPKWKYVMKQLKPNKKPLRRAYKRIWPVVKNKPANAQALQSHIVLKWKEISIASPRSFKTRLVAGGNRQVHQGDYEKIYIPVVDFTTCLSVLLLALVMEWYTRHVYVRAASLNGDIDRLLYIMFPYNIPKSNKQKMHRPRKPLYGLKQAALLWFTKLKSFLTLKLKYEQHKTNCFVFVQRDSNGDINIILAYVVDLIFVSSCADKLKKNVTKFCWSIWRY